ncbi:MAG TPA: hypothetical protein VMB71_00030 [Acetobacteraceae bacterium]|nr:hypothetical protein [Acetobacteraceae bacterium]
MKLRTSDNMELMHVSAITPEDGNLIIEGTIMGAMPIRAVLTPEELRAARTLMNRKTIFAVLGMMVRRSKQPG